MSFFRPLDLRPLRLFVVLAALGGGVQLGFSAYTHAVRRSGVLYDMDGYDSLARNLLSRGELSITPGRPTAQREPLYPLGLASAYAVLGRSWVSIFAFHFLLFCQMLFD